MEKTTERNAILILVAPRAQKFAVVGDEGVHQKCGEEFWQQLVEAMREHFKPRLSRMRSVEAIEERRALLAQHFPRLTTIETSFRTTLSKGEGRGACKAARLVLIPRPQRVFEVAPLVPGFPSLDGSRTRQG